MITIDRTSSIPIVQQLVHQIRYEIASGRFRVGDLLPSTRELAKQISVSFHTVRKAYLELEGIGLLTAVPGKGYLVNPPVESGTEKRMEEAASVVEEALQRLIGLGLDEGDIEFLLEEQMTYLEKPTADRKVLFCAQHLEMAESCAEQAKTRLQEDVQPVPIRQLARHPDADYILTPFTLMQSVMIAAPRAEILGVSVYHRPKALQRIAGLLPTQTLGLLTRYGNAIASVINQIKQETGFAGQILAASTDLQRVEAEQLLSGADLIVYTPQVKRTIRSLFPEKLTLEWAPVIGKESLENACALIPR